MKTKPEIKKYLLDHINQKVRENTTESLGFAVGIGDGLDLLVNDELTETVYERARQAVNDIRDNAKYALDMGARCVADAEYGRANGLCEFLNGMVGFYQ